MTLHPSVNTSYGSAFEATQVSAVPPRAMDAAFTGTIRGSHREALFRDALGVTIRFDRTVTLLKEYSHDHSA